MAAITYRRVETTAEFEQGKTLFKAYLKELDFKIDFQNIEKEFAQIRQQYAAPEGTLIIAYQKDRPIGCIGVRKLEDEIGEIKRMFVKPSFRNRQVGKKLLQLSIDQATQLGYRKVRLDSLKRMKSAVKLYKNFGFYEISAYRHNPMKDALFLEKEIGDQ